MRFFFSCQTPSSQQHDQDPHVIFFGIDGVGSHNLWPTDKSIASPRIPYLEQLIKESAFSKRATIDHRNWSGPNWAGMLTGKDSDVHGVTTNDCVTPTVPTIFDIAAEKATHFQMGMVVNWASLTCYSQPKSLYFSRHVDGGSAAVSSSVLSILSQQWPNLLFIYFVDPDAAGHSYGAKSSQYKAAIENVDHAIGQILTQLKQDGRYEKTQIVLSADHGHIGTQGHSDDSYPVPFVVHSDKVNPGEILASIKNRDATPIMLWLLGMQTNAPF